MNHRYLFVGGLHRSGTSLLTRLISQCLKVAAIADAPVPENEGVYLQGAIPHTAVHGIPGAFGTDSSQHLTERSPYNSLETTQRIEWEWDPWFSPRDALWRVEKSPVNCTRMRLYQQLFPLSQFILIVRHPEIVAAATAKWSDCSYKELVQYWIDSHEQILDDLRYIHSAMVVRYEDLATDPTTVMRAIAAFLALGTDSYVAEIQVSEPLRNRNNEYLPLPQTPGFDENDVCRLLGYGSVGLVMPYMPLIQHPLRAIRERTQSYAAMSTLGKMMAEQ